MDFRRIELTDKEKFSEFVLPTHMGWEYNFGVLWCWDIFDKTFVHIEDNFMVAYNEVHGKKIFLPPYVKSDEYLCKALSIINDYCKSINEPVIIRGLDKSQISCIDNTKFEVVATRDDFDYIYLADDLKNLQGKKFHSKRNFLSRFTKTYNYQLRDYMDSDFDKLLNVYDNWSKETEHSQLDIERKAISRALQFYKELDLNIGVLEVDGKIVAFQILSLENKDVIHIYFEKADTSYTGIFQAINALCAQKYFNGAKYVNRQEDMGIEGLRKAKLSYNPVMLLEKYYVTEREKL